MKPPQARPRSGPLSAIGDTLRYITTWSTTGAVAPSGPFLARRMVRDIDPRATAPILELGPGNGVVTKALIARGVPPDHIIAVEYNGQFCRLLTHRFPGVKIVEGDAFHLEKTLAGTYRGPFSAVISSIPLLMWPLPERQKLVRDALSRLVPGGTMVQFSYAPRPPVPALAGEFRVDGSPYVVLNVPPARVWTYRPA